MIQAIGLTSAPRRRHRPAVDDLTFEARTGSVTVLLGPEGAGKTSALRLLLQLQSGRGVALFNGRPVHRIPHLAREVGILLGDVPGHPARTARGHLRMLAAVAGVPAERSDDVLDVVGLSGLAEHRLGLYSLGMDRRLGIASALLADPHTLVLDEPTKGLSPRETAWLHALLRGYAEQGGSVLVTCREPKEAAQLADRVVTMDGGRLVADQTVTDFTRTRLRPRVAVNTPHAERLADLLAAEARSAWRITGSGTGSMEIVHEGGNRISVYGSSCAEVGDVAYRNDILVHQLADETGDTGDTSAPAPLVRADGRLLEAASHESRPAPQPQQLITEFSAESAHATHGRPSPSPVTDPASDLLAEPSAEAEAEAVSEASTRVVEPLTGTGSDSFPQAADRPDPVAPSSEAVDSPTLTLTLPATAPPTKTALEPTDNPAFRSQRRPAERRRSSTGLPPRLYTVAHPGPAAPIRYELRRLFGIRTTWIVIAATVLIALALAVGIAMAGGTADGSTTPSGQSLAPALRLLTGWPAGSAFPLPPAALAAGLLGALAFGQEFRYPVLAPAQASVPRRLGMLCAKLFVSAVLAFALCALTALVNAMVLTLLLGTDTLDVGAAVTGNSTSAAPASGYPGELRLQAASVPMLAIGCAWAGLLAAGVFRSTLVGTAAVVAIPVLVAPAVRSFLGGPAGESLEGLPERLRAMRIVLWPAGADGWLPVVARLAVQPVGRALALSLTVLLCAYLFTSLRGRTR